MYMAQDVAHDTGWSTSYPQPLHHYIHARGRMQNSDQSTNAEVHHTVPHKLGEHTVHRLAWAHAKFRAIDQSGGAHLRQDRRRTVQVPRACLYLGVWEGVRHPGVEAVAHHLVGPFGYRALDSCGSGGEHARHDCLQSFIRVVVAPPTHSLGPLARVRSRAVPTFAATRSAPSYRALGRLGLTTPSPHGQPCRLAPSSAARE